MNATFTSAPRHSEARWPRAQLADLDPAMAGLIASLDSVPLRLRPGGFEGLAELHSLHLFGTEINDFESHARPIPDFAVCKDDFVDTGFDQLTILQPSAELTEELILQADDPFREGIRSVRAD